MPTRAIQMSQATMASWPNVVAYTYDPEQKLSTPISGASFSPKSLSMYEITVVNDKGSWWLPADTTVDPLWNQHGGSEALKASDDISTTMNGATVMRPSWMFFWTPVHTLANQTFQADIKDGSIIGTFPQIQPITSDQPSSGFIIHELPDGLQIIVPPSDQPLTVQITTQTS
ncbi:MAG: hypothetical protein ETSY1_37210 [Candidatus Entotheonella factor]|uniref:Uncharacterized protein n=1 Tax=Entotheonella factor TaxID=1429438 RepID=W4L799_ENTF1|nr:MAG: hypothetical protein ETSY1_37210 [Candidatus Entotheonella factor]